MKLFVYSRRPSLPPVPRIGGNARSSRPRITTAASTQSTEASSSRFRHARTISALVPAPDFFTRVTCFLRALRELAAPILELVGRLLKGCRSVEVLESAPNRLWKLTVLRLLRIPFRPIQHLGDAQVRIRHLWEPANHLDRGAICGETRVCGGGDGLDPVAAVAGIEAAACVPGRQDGRWPVLLGEKTEQAVLIEFR